MKSDGANEKSMELPNHSESDKMRTVFTQSHSADTHSLFGLELRINLKPMTGTTLVYEQLVLSSVGTLGLYMYAC